jgi:hypothetical protein
MLIITARDGLTAFLALSHDVGRTCKADRRKNGSAGKSIHGCTWPRVTAEIKRLFLTV